MAIGSNITPLGKQTTTAAARKQATGSSTAAPCYSLVIQALPGNAGNITVGDSTVVASTGAGAISVLAPGQSTSISTGAQFDAAGVNVDVATSSDGWTGWYVAA